ncbi:MAG: sulfotransferase [Erythrobacter sp.]|nr:MAG: sulfotransferase [Erythrobacter sp.]
MEDYSWADRMVHRLAFGARAPQALLREMEQSKFGGAIAAQHVTAPVFITALPRAGTTLVLELLAQHPLVATHRYRDMPFVLSPVIWRQLSRRFQVKADAKERSHGDGMMVDADSPEAFEEVFWLRHLPGDFSDRGIATRDGLPADTADALRDYMRALVLARGVPGARYVSKNNANVARLPALASAFPDARILVPLRHPLDQAQSLLHQHRKALASHSASRFARAYPRDIGHFEFGADHRPILFAGMDAVIAAHTPDSIEYWLGYWIAAMRHVEACGLGEVLDMQRFTSAPDGVATLFARLGLPAASEVPRAAQAMVAPIKSYGAPVESSLAREAMALYEDMRSKPDCLF